MSNETQTLTDLKDLRGAGAGTATAQPAAAVREPKIDAFGRSYATGRRKNAVARVWL